MNMYYFTASEEELVGWVGKAGGGVKGQRWFLLTMTLMFV